MSIDDAIERLSNCHPITEEDKEVFECAIGCMKFTKDFLPLGASPERMEHALNLLNSLEYMLNDTKTENETYDEAYADGAKELAKRLKEWFVEHSNYWFSHTANMEIDEVLNNMIGH